MNKVILGGYVKIKTGKLDANASEENGKYPFFTCAREISRINTYAFNCECVLVAGNGELNVKYYEGKFNAYQRTYVIESMDHQILSTKYLYYFINSYIEKLRNGAIGGVIKYIKLNHLTDIELPLPDLETQDKIVAVLDKAKSLIDKREQTIKMFDELLKATFLDMFGQPNKNKSNNDFLENISLKITDGTHQSPTFLNKGVPFLLVSNIINNEIVYKTKKYISEDEYKVLNKRTPIEIGDILITSVGSYGNPAMVKTITKFAFQRHIAYIKPDQSKINSVYLLNALKSDYVNFQIEKVVKGAAQKTLNLSDLRKITVPVPDIKIQNKFEIIYLKFEKYKASLIQSKTQIENLLNALSQSAFNGELEFNTAVDLEVFLENDYAYFKDNADKKAIQLLLDRLDKNELNLNRFHDQNMYDKAKSFVFELLKKGEIEQVFDKKTNTVKLTM